MIGKSRQLFAALTVAVALIGFSAQPARASADISACFDMVGNAVNTVTHAVDNVASFLDDPNCLAVSGTNTIMFGIVTGIVTAVNASGAFGGNDAESCSNAINGAIASAIIAALSAALDDGSPLGAIIPEDARDPIKTIAVNLATDPAVLEQVNSWLSSVPVVGQAIGMLPCACKLSAAVVQAANDIIETVKSAAACGEFLVNCIGSPLECLGSMFESGLEAIEDAQGALMDFLCGSILPCPSPPPPPPTMVDCMGGATLSGEVVSAFGYSDTKLSRTTNQWCVCTGDMKFFESNGVWSCGCPGANEVPTGYGSCDCAEGLSRKDYFAGDRTCKPCPDGSKPSPFGLGCDCLKEGAQLVSLNGKEVCNCPPEMRDVGGKCVVPCPAGQIRTSLGVCCASGRVTACGQCCRTPNCADESAPAPGRGLSSSCCAPGQVKAAGGCGVPDRITRAGFVCRATSMVSDDGLDCTPLSRPLSTPVRLPPRNDGARAAAPIKPGSRSGSPGVPQSTDECPPGQVMINGICGFPQAGAGGTTTQSGSPGVGPNKNQEKTKKTKAARAKKKPLPPSPCRDGERSCILTRGSTGSPGVVTTTTASPGVVAKKKFKPLPPSPCRKGANCATTTASPGVKIIGPGLLDDAATFNAQSPSAAGSRGARGGRDR